MLNVTDLLMLFFFLKEIYERSRLGGFALDNHGGSRLVLRAVNEQRRDSSRSMGGV